MSDETTVVELWLSALEDTPLSSDRVRRYRIRSEKAVNSPARWWDPNGIPPDGLLTDEDDQSAMAERERHHIGLIAESDIQSAEDRAFFVALTRHELQHAIQWEIGEESCRGLGTAIFGVYNSLG